MLVAQNKVPCKMKGKAGEDVFKGNNNYNDDLFIYEAHLKTTKLTKAH